MHTYHHPNHSHQIHIYRKQICTHVYIQDHRKQIQMYCKQICLMKCHTHLHPNHRQEIHIYQKQICTHIYVQTTDTKFIYIGNRYAHISMSKPQTPNSYISEIEMHTYLHRNRQQIHIYQKYISTHVYIQTIDNKFKYIGNRYAQ